MKYYKVIRSLPQKMYK